MPKRKSPDAATVQKYGTPEARGADIVYGILECLLESAAYGLDDPKARHDVRAVMPLLEAMRRDLVR